MKTSELDLVRSICKASLEDFVREFWETVVQDRLLWNWHMSEVCRELQEVTLRCWRGEPKEYDLAVNICPGSSKSTMATVMLIPWAWTFWPQCCVIGASYSDDLALELSGKCRDVILSDKYKELFPHVRLRQDANAKGKFQNTKGGVRYAVGTRGTVQGKHGHLIVIDDPIDPNRAVSEAELYQTNEWIKSTLMGRKKSKTSSVVVLIMQRLHQADPTALLTAPGKKTRHLVVPGSLDFPVKPSCLAENYRGGLMDPVRLPRSALREAEMDMGPYHYAGQFGQKPVPLGGGMFKTDNLQAGPVPAQRDFVRVVRYWDKAATAHSHKNARRASHSVGVKLGKDRWGRFWVLDVFRRQVDSHSREQHIRRTALQDGRAVEIGIEQEGASGGKDSALATLQRLPGFRVRIVPARGDKAVRADEFSVQVNGGNVWLPNHLLVGQGESRQWTGWARDYVDELTHFPFSTSADQVDASSGAFNLAWKRRRQAGVLGQVQSRQPSTPLSDPEDIGDGLPPDLAEEYLGDEPNPYPPPPVEVPREYRTPKPPVRPLPVSVGGSGIPTHPPPARPQHSAPPSAKPRPPRRTPAPAG